MWWNRTSICLCQTPPWYNQTTEKASSDSLILFAVPRIFFKTIKEMGHCQLALNRTYDADSHLEGF